MDRVGQLPRGLDPGHVAGVGEQLEPGMEGGGLVATDRAGLAQLKRDLAAVVSAEALFVLTDLAGLDSEDAIASLVRTATTITKAAFE